MSYDNRIISSEPYVINTITTDNRILKRHPNNVPLPRKKKSDTSNNFKETLNTASGISENSALDETSTFNNELDNISMLKNNSIDNQLDFNSKTPTSSITNTSNSELHAKISEAMKIEVDVSKIYEKIKKLNSLKKQYQD